MGRYIGWDHLAGRYSQVVGFADAEEVGSNYITYGEAEVDARLAKAFDVPFASGSSYPTVRDLAIDFSYLRMSLGKDKTRSALRKELDGKIIDLCEGRLEIVDDSGEVIGRGGLIGGTIWSSTENYTPVFGIGNIEDMEPDTDQVDDEEAARGH